MPERRIGGALIAALALAGCSHAGPPPQTYAEKLVAMNETCRASGGMLTPLSNAVSDEPANDFICVAADGRYG